MNRSRWDERYAGEVYAFGRSPNDFLVEAASRIPGGPVLCLGDGEGRNGVFLARLGFEVTSLDQSAVGLAKAERLATESGVRIHPWCIDLAEADLGRDRWSGIVSIFCHLPPDLRRDVHRRAARALRPGGIFLLEAYTPAQVALGTGGPRDPVLCMRLDELRDELADLEILEAQELRREVREGRHHHGPSEVVRLIARRPITDAND